MRRKAEKNEEAAAAATTTAFIKVDKSVPVSSLFRLLFDCLFGQNYRGGYTFNLPSSSPWAMDR